ncbi:class I adenylate-forming enzyme family protein [Nocardia sp. NBC_00511]|uniref:class I adenylate-forming enzyme family protein n=1 Tax=Nocardia sp. NBC_00511 TaxID=2903591 RepID=UPI0030E5915B
MHYAELPELRAARSPDLPCIADDDRALDNAEFLIETRRAAAVLAARGVGAGDVVALMLGNRVEFVVLMFAAWRLGAAVTPINPALTAAEAEYQIADSGAAVVVVDGIALAAPILEVAEFATADVEYIAPAMEAELALLIYTSGTTGKPKGVMLDHVNLIAMHVMADGFLSFDERDHALLILPLFHVNGIVVSVLAPLRSGGRVTIHGRFEPRGFLRALEIVRPTYFSGVPTIFAMLAALPPEVTADISSVRLAICGAAPAAAELLTGFEARFGIKICEGYGLSETTCGVTLNPPQGIGKAGTVGLPFPGQRVAILGPDDALAARGELGEIAVAGPHVMRGYLHRPDETAHALRGGWLHTGDIGRFDEDGYLIVAGRIKDMIIRGGENIYPKEIEDILTAHPAVYEAAVIGAPDPKYGEIPTAFVVLRPGAWTTAAELIALCASSLAKYKRPDFIDLLDELPHNAIGKVDKLALRARRFPADAVRTH